LTPCDKHHAGKSFRARRRSDADVAPRVLVARRVGPDSGPPMGGAAASDRMTAPATMKGEVLDDFTDLSGWTPVASGQAQLDISPDRGPRGGALRLDFDFKGGGGFVVARKRFSFPLPEAYAFTFDVHGVAPANKLEFKLIDPSGHNVWRYQEDGFGFPAEWRSLRIRSSQIDFAWGPAGSGPMRQVGAIEFAIAAPPGGKGTVWIANLCLEDHSVRSTPAVQASPAHKVRVAQYVAGRLPAPDQRSIDPLRGGSGSPWMTHRRSARLSELSTASRNRAGRWAASSCAAPAPAVDPFHC